MSVADAGCNSRRDITGSRLNKQASVVFLEAATNEAKAEQATPNFNISRAFKPLTTRAGKQHQCIKWNIEFS